MARKGLGTLIDVGSHFLAPIGVPAQLISYGLTGQSLGANLAGDSLASDVTDPIVEKTGLWEGKSLGEGVVRSLNDLSLQQLHRASQIEQELNETGRPIMDDQVRRQREIAELAEQYAREGMPEEQRQMAANDIARNQQTQLAAMSSLGAGLRGLGQTQASTAQAYRNLATQDAMMAQQNQGQYLGALGQLGVAEGMAEQYNELMPYEQKLAELQALMGAGQQNQMNAQQQQYMMAMANRQLGADILGLGVQAGSMAVGA